MINIQPSQKIEDESKNETRKIKIDKFVFSLNEIEKTAFLVDTEDPSGDVFIPISIKSEGKEFFITSINEGAFRLRQKIRSIQFPIDSKVQKIEKEAFIDSSVEYISIPPSITILEDGCFNGTSKLLQITIDPQNQHFKKLEYNFIYGKSDATSSEFDTLIYVKQTVTQITIPPYTKIIGPFTFSKTLINTISIPSSVTQICDKSFSFCNNLQTVLFSPDSQLQTIGDHAFCSTPIKRIVIPSHVKKICQRAFSHVIIFAMLNFLLTQKFKQLRVTYFSYHQLRVFQFHQVFVS